jgi:hypothetical protein
MASNNVFLDTDTGKITCAGIAFEIVLAILLIWTKRKTGSFLNNKRFACSLVILCLILFAVAYDSSMKSSFTGFNTNDVNDMSKTDFSFMIINAIILGVYALIMLKKKFMG